MRSNTFHREKSTKTDINSLQSKIVDLFITFPMAQNDYIRKLPKINLFTCQIVSLICYVNITLIVLV